MEETYFLQIYNQKSLVKSLGRYFWALLAETSLIVLAGVLQVECIRKLLLSPAVI